VEAVAFKAVVVVADWVKVAVVLLASATTAAKQDTKRLIVTPGRMRKQEANPI
jgi:hypothetical protein